MITLHITPRHDCPYCHGSGTVYDTVDYGSTTAQLPSLCDCVAEQVPDGSEDAEIVVMPSQPVMDELAELRQVLAVYRDKAAGAQAEINEQRRRADVAEAERDQLRAMVVAYEVTIRRIRWLVFPVSGENDANRMELIREAIRSVDVV